MTKSPYSHWILQLDPRRSQSTSQRRASSVCHHLLLCPFSQLTCPARNNLRAHRAQQAALVSERNALRDADRNPDADEIRFFSNRTEPVTASDTVDWAHAAERAHARRVATAVTAITNVSAVYLDNVESRAVTIRQIEAEIDATTAANAAAEHTEPVTAAPINTNETHGAQIGVNHAASLSQTYAGHQAAVAVTGITAPASSSHTPVEQEQTQVVDFAAPSSERTLVDVATPSSSQTSSARTSVDDYFDLPSDDDAAEDEGEPLTEQDRRIMARSFAIQAAERMQERANFAILRDWRPLTEDEFEE